MSNLFRFIKTSFIFIICFSQASNAADAFCYRDQSSILNCQKSIDLVPPEYRAKAFYKEVVDVKVSPVAKPFTQEQTSSPPTVLPPAPTTRLPPAAIPEKDSPKEEVISPNNYLPPATNLPSKPQEPISSSADEILKKPSSADVSTKNSSPKIQIFVAKWCPHCKALEEFLISEKLKYSRYDVEEDSYGIEVFNQEGGGIPISKIGETTIIGFDEAKFRALIDAQKPY